MQGELLACDAEEPWRPGGKKKKKTLSGSFVVTASFKLKAKQTPRYAYRY